MKYFLFFITLIAFTGVSAKLTNNPLFPTNTLLLQYEADLDGTVLVKHIKTGQYFVLKGNKDPEIMKEEILADALYRAMDVPVPDFEIYSLSEIKHLLGLYEYKWNPSGPFRLSVFIQEEDNPTLVGPTKTNKLFFTELRKHFIIDAYLSNWDISVIKERQNVIVDANQKLWRIDNGGAMLNRAQGKPKIENNKWNLRAVTELRTLEFRRAYAGGNYIQTQINDFMRHGKIILQTLNKYHKLLNFKNYSRIYQFFEEKAQKCCQVKPAKR